MASRLSTELVEEMAQLGVDHVERNTMDAVCIRVPIEMRYSEEFLKAAMDVVSRDHGRCKETYEDALT